MRRIYKKGRSTAGLICGEKVRRLSEITAGDVLIHLSHRFRAQNPIRVEAMKDVPKGFDYRHLGGGRLMFMHDFEINSRQDELFCVVKN